MDAFIFNGFWVLVGLLFGGGAVYVPLSMSISKVREDAVMKKDCAELSELRAKPAVQSMAKLTAEVLEVKTDVKEIRKELGEILIHISGRAK
ncbi:MAG TPA: hypothetical protein VMW58_05120 [Anaerolineae bacterium]|nr:hypothetical protein [Anaerolineae bacterium]